MSWQQQAEVTDTNVPVTLVVNQNGGVTGLTAVITVRDGSTTDSYLDFGDAPPTFKTSGWITKTAALADIGNGVYALSGGLDVSAMSGLVGDHLIIEHNVSGSVSGDAVDMVLLREHLYDIPSDVSDEILTGATHNIPTSLGRRLRAIQDFGLYEGGSVWVDEVGGQSTGVEPGEDATVRHQSDDFDNAVTVAEDSEVDLSRIHIHNGNTITLTAALSSFNVWGESWELVLNGQDISNCIFSNAVRGIRGIGIGSDPRIENSEIDSVTLPPGRFELCGLTGPFIVGGAGDFQFIDCHSSIPGASSPTVDLGAAVGATTMEFRRWSGGLTLNNVKAGDIISVDVVSGGTITVNGTGGEVHIRGMVEDIVDNSGGAVAITTMVPATDDEASRLHGENARTQLSFADAEIDTGTRFVPLNAVSHLHVQVKAEEASDWSAPVEDFYVVFNYKALANSSDGTAASTTQASAPVDGSFTTVDYPS